MGNLRHIIFMWRQSCHHTETSQLICSVSTGFHMIAGLAFNELIQILNRKPHHEQAYHNKKKNWNLPGLCYVFKDFHYFHYLEELLASNWWSILKIFSLFEYWASMLKTTYWIMRKTAAGNIEAEEALLPNQAKIPHGLTLELLIVKILAHALLLFSLKVISNYLRKNWLQCHNDPHHNVFCYSFYVTHSS